MFVRTRLTPKEFDDATVTSQMRCTFCGKPHTRLPSSLRAGVYICNECVDLMVDIIASRPPEAPSLPSGLH